MKRYVYNIAFYRALISKLSIEACLSVSDIYRTPVKVTEWDSPTNQTFVKSEDT